jgi:hypothetical protein
MQRNPRPVSDDSLNIMTKMSPQFFSPIPPSLYKCFKGVSPLMNKGLHPIFYIKIQTCSNPWHVKPSQILQF